MDKLLRDAMTFMVNTGEYTETKAYQMLDLKVVAEFDIANETTWKRWPGPHRNVLFWVVLENGKAVGFNENVARGWSFPVIKYKV